MLRLLPVTAMTVLVLAGSVSARTWYVKADGTGDAPTIQAGVDSTAAGDTVLVGPGTYYNGPSGVDVRENVVVTSEWGPLETTLMTAAWPPTYGVFTVRSGAEVSGFWIKPVEIGSIGVVGSDARVLRNIIEVSGSIAIGIEIHARATIESNLIMGGGTGIKVAIWSDPPSWLENNIILNGIDCRYGIVAGYCNDVMGPRCLGELSADPQFCGVEGSGNYYLQADSPCAPGNGLYYCGLIGPLPVGCGAVAVKETTWGAIKMLYEDGISEK
jgi:hypothetical protein